MLPPIARRTRPCQIVNFAGPPTRDRQLMVNMKMTHLKFAGAIGASTSLTFPESFHFLYRHIARNTPPPKIPKPTIVFSLPGILCMPTTNFFRVSQSPLVSVCFNQLRIICSPRSFNAQTCFMVSHSPFPEVRAYTFTIFLVVRATVISSVGAAVFNVFGGPLLHILTSFFSHIGTTGVFAFLTANGGAMLLIIASVFFCPLALVFFWVSSLSFFFGFFSSNPSTRTAVRLESALRRSPKLVC